MPTPPAGFLKQLDCIDPTYFVYFNEEYGYWEIKKKMDFDRKIDEDAARNRQIRARAKDPTVGVFFRLNDDALLDLRKRKYLGLKHHRANREDDYLNWIISQNREAKAKKRQMALEMMAEGMMKMHRMETSHTVVYGSKAYDARTTQVGGP